MLTSTHDNHIERPRGIYAIAALLVAGGAVVWFVEPEMSRTFKVVSFSVMAGLAFGIFRLSNAIRIIVIILSSLGVGFSLIATVILISHFTVLPDASSLALVAYLIPEIIGAALNALIVYYLCKKDVALLFGVEPHGNNFDEHAPCPFCEKPLRSSAAKQCPHCLMQWRDPDNPRRINT